MHLPQVFSRWKGSVPAGGVALGSDSAPTLPPNLTTASNILHHKVSNNLGYPAQRLIVGYKPPSATTVSLNVVAYVWDDTSQYWYQIGSSKQLQPGRANFFDSLGLNEPAVVRANLETPTSGATYVAFVITDPSSGAPNGEHVFTLGSDITQTEGLEESIVSPASRFRQYTMAGSDIDLVANGGGASRGILPLGDGTLVVQPLNPIGTTETIDVLQGIREDIQITKVLTSGSTAGLKFRVYWG